MLLFAGRADHGTDGGPRWAPRTRSGRADEGAARSGRTHRRDRSHTLSQIVLTKPLGVDMNRGAGNQSGCGSAVRRNATRRGSVARAGAGWKLATSVHTTAARGVHRSRSSAEVERRGQGADRCGDRGERRLGLFSGPTAWIVAAAVVWLATSVAKSLERSFRSGRSTVRAGVSIGVQILDAE
jgi:hypothetical protein